MKTKIAILACLLLSPILRADPLVPQPHWDHREFVVHPATPELPAMKYELMVDAADRQAGNAAPLYMEAMLLSSEKGDSIIDRGETMHEQGKPLKGDKELVDYVGGTNGTFDLLALAARKEQCDWMLPLHEMGFKALLPHLNNMRAEANRMHVRAWLEIENGQTPELLETIRSLYALGQNAGKNSVLVGGLVGVGIQHLTSEVVADWSEQPDAPNLYWGLVNLPRPFISFRDAMQSEHVGVTVTVPVLAKGRHGGIVADDWQAYIDQMTAAQSLLTQTSDQSSKAGIDAVAIGLTSLPAAKKFYADTRHIAPEDVDKMNSRLLLATYFIEQYQIASDEMDKLLGLPFADQIKAADRWKNRLDELGIDQMNIARIMLPAVSRAAISFARADRQIVALTAVHALRAYAADHGGQLPAKLEDVTQTPIPVNPMTGKMFDYTLEDGTATISDQTSPGSTGKDGKGLVYTVRLEGL
jgi:hypothetical protein